MGLPATDKDVRPLLVPLCHCCVLGYAELGDAAVRHNTSFIVELVWVRFTPHAELSVVGEEGGRQREGIVAANNFDLTHDMSLDGRLLTRLKLAQSYRYDLFL